MVTFSCSTCNTTTEESDMLKHLSTTRHKNVIYDPLQETIACEECLDTNIHQLLILRFGLSDMALLCALCLGKEEKPATQYSLSNGSLLKKLGDYYRFRDISCSICNSEKHLSVGKGKRGQVIVCRNCIPKIEEKIEFVAEDSDNFLYALLGIKEFVPPKSSGKLFGARRGRKVGRKGGKRGKAAGARSVSKDGDEKSSHFHNARASAMAIKSGKTILAVGSSDVSPLQSKLSSKNNSRAPSRSSTPKFGQKSGGNTSTKSNSTTPSKSFKKSEPATKTTSTQKANSKKIENTSPKENRKVPKTDNAVREQKPTKAGKKQQNVGGSKSVKAVDNQKPSQKPVNRGKKLEDPQKSEDKQGKQNESKPPIKQPAKSAKPNKREVSLKSDSKPTKANSAKTKVETSKSESTKKTPGIAIPLHIKKYETSPEPPLTFESMTKYFQEMSHNLFLEEKLSIQLSNNSIINPEDMKLEWYADQDKKHKQFKVTVPLTEEILNRLMSKKMQQIRKVPFSVNQAIFLILGEDIPWFGNIVTAEAKSAQKGRRGGMKIFEMVVELYKWNTQPLPTSVDVRLLKILPASIPVSRVFMAMSRIENPKFIKMLLGKEPIRQIVFRNYLKFTKDTFNDSQKVAIQSVLNNSITVLQGPPGTGKTSTIYEIILQLLENLSTYPILVVAASNIAIDNIAEKLIGNHQRSILRIVSNEKEKEYTRDHPLGSICLHHKVYDSLPNNLKETINDLRNPRATVSQNQFKKLLTQQIDVSDTLIAQAKVIFTTTVVAGGNQLKSVKKLPVVIMDEATQSSEPTTLIPLSMPGVEKFVFVGDQKQLSSFSQVPNLSLSLFERVLLNGTYRTPHMLDTQYRMHPLISDFPRRRFYQSLLKDGIGAEDRKMDKIPDNPVYFWDTCRKHQEGRVRIGFREDRGFTYSNKGEVSFVTEVLTKLIYEKGVKRSDIGVITPYRGQRDLISSILVENDLINPEKNDILVEVDRDDIYNDSKPVTIHTVSDIMIASIDAFQGREKNFLIMSCVRSNETNKIGFLSDERRLNVALTRAKYGLIIIGDVECLRSGDSLWKEYLDDLEQKSCIFKEKDFNY